MAFKLWFVNFNVVQELKGLQDKNVTRPSLDDSLNEEKEIENVTQEITKVLEHVFFI